MAYTIQHECHDHPLRPTGTTVTDETAVCRACACAFTSGRQLYGCRNCGFFLHRSCASLSPLLEGHPAHHPCSLYLGCSTDAFFCNICGKHEDGGFNYHCVRCKFVAHFMCAHLPRTARLRGHRHPLRLVFRAPAGGTISCHGCRLQIRHCYYKCRS